MAALDGYIYAIGGYDGTSRLSTVERYCPKTKEKKKKCTIHTYLFKVVVVVIVREYDLPVQSVHITTKL
jgi:hypothetical protein